VSGWRAGQHVNRAGQEALIQEPDGVNLHGSAHHDLTMDLGVLVEGDTLAIWLARLAKNPVILGNGQNPADQGLGLSNDGDAPGSQIPITVFVRYDLSPRSDNALTGDLGSVVDVHDTTSHLPVLFGNLLDRPVELADLRFLDGDRLSLQLPVWLFDGPNYDTGTDECGSAFLGKTIYRYIDPFTLDKPALNLDLLNTPLDTHRNGAGR
jgi:hypothetical protein